MRRKWALAGSALVLCLSFWGFLGKGTALSVVPESQEAPPEIEEEADEDAGVPTAPVRRYDATSRRREGPLKDPFHMEGIRKINEEMKQNLGQGKTASPAKGKKEAPAEMPPRLKGILSYKGERRALIEWNGKVKTVSEGEQLGSWTISEIGENQAVLASPAGTTVLANQ